MDKQTDLSNDISNENTIDKTDNKLSDKTIDKTEIKTKGEKTKEKKIKTNDKKIETKDDKIVVKTGDHHNHTSHDSDSNNNAIYKIWDIVDAYELPDTKYTIKGFSLAALRTNFYIKELGILLDAGLSMPNVSMEYIFVTHAHSDHVANIPFHIYSARVNENNTGNIQMYCPEESTKKINDFIISAYVMSSDTDESIKRDELYLHNYYKLNSVKPEQKLELMIKNKKFVVEVIKCFHSIPCVGYGFSEVRQKLKEEYKNLAGKEIGELRKKGIEINYNQEYHIFCYLGDTNKDILKSESIKKYRTIMIECTFIMDDEMLQAEKTFHIHWKDIEGYIKENKDKTFILYHFSQRYNTNELREFFKKQDLKNVIPWIN